METDRTVEIKCKSNTNDLFLLFSVDVIDSTKMKYSASENEKDPSKNNEIKWVDKIGRFYNDFSHQFINSFTGTSQINIWKFVGDEILFYSKIEKNCYHEIVEIIRSFWILLDSWYKPNDPKALKLKGCVWTAQADKIDRCTHVHSISPNFRIETLDFIGPSVDCGFRIAKEASHSAIAMSIEIVDQIYKEPTLRQKIIYVDSKKFKGVFQNEFTCPIFVLNLPRLGPEIKDLSLRSSLSEDSIKDFIDVYYEGMENSQFSPFVHRVKKEDFGFKFGVSISELNEISENNENQVVSNCVDRFLKSYEKTDRTDCRAEKVNFIVETLFEEEPFEIKQRVAEMIHKKDDFYYCKSKQ